jgi:dTDP-4-amino-4,6-dideoxygalactose transaminase
MNELEAHLASWLDAEHAMTFGRGSTALYALFRTLAAETPEGEVLIPELCCETIPVAAWLAGLKPVMVDVDPETLGVSVGDVAEKLGPNTRALVLIHLFGIPVDIEPFLLLKTHHDFLVIEDIAQAVGGEHHSRRLGTQGDVALLSFDDRKILHGAGGALVIRERSRRSSSIEAMRDEIDLRSSVHGSEQLKASLRNVTHGLADLSRADRGADIASPFRSLLPHYEPVVVLPRSGHDHGEIALQIDEIETERTRRLGRYLRYKAGLRGSRWRVLDFPEGAMCWRVPIVAPNASAAVDASQRLLADGLPASNHYFPFGQFVDGTSAPVADDIGRRLLNVWVDDAVDTAGVDRSIELLLHR